MKRRKVGRPRKRGAPKGNTNALKTGEYTRENVRRRRKLRALISEIRWYLAHEKIARAQRLANNGGEISKNK
ncbi:MAG: hypothetical protein WAW96_08360 [Alphaproteobacteria bacterium]